MTIANLPTPIGGESFHSAHSTHPPPASNAPLATLQKMLGVSDMFVPTLVVHGGHSSDLRAYALVHLAGTLVEQSAESWTAFRVENEGQAE